MLEIVHYEVHCNSVLFGHYFRPTPGHDNICIFHSWFNELNEGRFDISVVGLEDTFYRTTTLDNVSIHTPNKSDIIVCVDEDLEIKLSIYFRVVEAKNTFDNDERRPFAEQAFSISFTGDIVVVRNGDILSSLNLPYRFLKKLPIKHRRMIEVDLTNIGHLFLCTLLVEAINWNESALLVFTDSHALENLLRHCRFARGCSSCNSHDNRLLLTLIVISSKLSKIIDKTLLWGLAIVRDCCELIEQPIYSLNHQEIS